MDFNQQAYVGLGELTAKYGNKVTVKYVENIYQVVDIQPALKDYADQGYDLIIGHGFQFQDPIMAIASQYPNVHFAIGPGAYETAANVSDYDADNAQVGYVMGTVAGLVTQSKIIGSIGGIDVPNVDTIHRSYLLAAQTVAPDVKVINVYNGDFTNADNAREAALTMISQGVDLIYTSGGGTMTPGILQAAKDKNVLFMTDSDMSPNAPTVFLANVNEDFGIAFEQMVADIQANTYGNKHYALTFQNGGLSLNVHLKDKTQAVQSQIDQVVNGLTGGTFQVPTLVSTPAPTPTK
jgi:basic membrane protein A